MRNKRLGWWQFGWPCFQTLGSLYQHQLPETAWFKWAVRLKRCQSQPCDLEQEEIKLSPTMKPADHHRYSFDPARRARGGAINGKEAKEKRYTLAESVYVHGILYGELMGASSLTAV